MLDKEEYGQTLAGLRLAAVAPDVPASAREHAAELLNRIGSGVRVVVLGPHGVGKTALCNILLGVDTGEVGTGSRWRVFTHDDAIESAYKDCKDFRKADRVRMGSQFLRYIQLIDVDTEGGLETQAQQVKAIMSRADMVLWCTENFGVDEAEIWSPVPDHLKDRSFLVLTKADAWAQEGTLHDRIAALQNVVADEFHSLFPITTLAVHANLAQGVPIQAQDLAASGIKALSDTVQKMASSGRRADLDSAYLFLDRHNVDKPQEAPETNSQPSSDIVPSSYSKALELMRERAQDFAALSQENLTEQVDEMLSLTSGLSEELSDLFSEDASTCEDFTGWRNDFFGASDKLVLMGLENDVRSAADAMTILVQLKRDIEYRTFE